MPIDQPRPLEHGRFGGAVRRRLDRLRGQLLNRIDAFAGDGPAHRAQIVAANGRATGIGIVGCGFVADFYAANLSLHPELRLIGCTDLNEARANAFAGRNQCTAFSTLDNLLEDGTIAIVVNLTNPASHAE